MNHDQFIYWLQGFVEMNGGKEPTKQQWQMIKDHLKLCFNKVTPTYPQTDPHQINPLQPPFKVTCNIPYAPGMGGVSYIASSGCGEKRNGGGGGC